MHSPIAATCSILSSCPPPRFHYSLRCRVRRAASRGRSAMHEIFSGVAVIPVLTIARAADAPPLALALLRGGRAGDLPYLPGAATPSEVMLARELGFSLLKFFPAAALGGVEMLRAYAAVFAGIAFCPTGGITPESAAQYLTLANVPLVGGSWMVPADAVAAGDWERIEDLAREAAKLGPAQTRFRF